MKKLFNPTSAEPFRLSRSMLDLFLNCPRCFYLDRKKGIARPPGFPFSLNSAVDTLLKKEFDTYREKQKPHPLMVANKIDAIPFKHQNLDQWRDALRRGIQYHHKKTNLLITGGVDDLWVNPQGEIIIVDYKATAKNGEVNLDADWQIGYKRQMDIYAWLFVQNGFQVSSTGYFVYCNGKLDAKSFDAHLEFKISVLPYTINHAWVEAAVVDAHKCLTSSSVPEAAPECDYCAYVESNCKA